MSMGVKRLGSVGLVSLGLVGTVGCRDLTFDGGQRISGDHVLAGRPSASGGSALTSAERAQGFFVSSDEALSALETDLREKLDLRVSLKSTVRAFASGSAAIRDPRAATPVLTTGPVTLAAQLQPDLSLPAILGGTGELATLCEHPLLAGIGSCGTTGLSALDGLPIDDLHIDLDSPNITVRWDEPDTSIDAVSDAPTLRVSVPFNLDLDPNDALGALIEINLQRLVVELRFQPQVCAADGCRTFGREIFSNYLPGTNIRMSLAGVDVRVASRLESRNYEIIPLPFCFLPGVEALIQPLFPVPPGAAPLSCVLVATEVIPPLIENGFAQVGTALGSLIDPMLNPPSIVLPTDGLPSWLSLDASRIFFRTNAATIGGVDSPSRTLSLAAASGAWTNNTVDVLARGANFSHIMANLSGSPIPAACAGPFGGLIESQCTALCGGSTATCAMTSAKVCFRFSPGGPECTGGLSLTRPQFVSLLTAIAAFPGSTFTATPDEINDMADQIATATAPIPALPNLATLFDSAPMIAKTMQSLFTKPLENAFGEGAFYSAIVSCPETGPRPSACPDGVNGPVFEFVIDDDRDGIPDETDACPEDAALVNVNSDGDEWCDANDECPFTPSAYNTSYYCDCDLDRDGCNNELFGTPVDGAPASVPQSCDPGEAGSYDERPGTSDRGADTPDMDGVSNDCDPDDDGDGDPDGADNCPSIANPEQEDYNTNGVGDACDPLCPGPGAPCPEAGGPEEGMHFDPIDFDLGAWILPGCLADGPGCWGFLRLACGGYDGGFCFDDLSIDVWQSGMAINLAKVPGDVRSLINVPDLNQDGVDDLLTAVADGEGGALRAIDGVTGKAIWETKSAAAGFGTSLAFVNGAIAVGAPEFSAKYPGSLEGAVLFYSFDGKLQGSVQGALGARLGTSLSVLSSVLYAGAPGGEDPKQPSYGRLYVVGIADSSLTLALDGAPLGSSIGLLPVVATQYQGIEVALVPSPGSSNAGRVFVMKRDGEKLGQVVAYIDGEAKSELGASISQPADFDGDGMQEVAIGAPGFEEGRGRIYFLASDGKLTPTNLGSAKGSRFAQSVVRLGDLNEDGLSELGVTLPGLDVSGAQHPGSHAVFSHAKQD